MPVTSKFTVKTIFPLFLGLAFSTVLVSQDIAPEPTGVIYKEINGVMTRLVPPDQIAVDANYLFTIRENLKQLEGTGEAAILSGISIEDLCGLVDNELSQEQRTELKSVLVEFNRKSGQISDHDHLGQQLLKIRVSKEIESILLPSQLEMIAEKTKRTKRILSLIVYSDYGQKLDISPKQKQKLIAECKLANKSINETLQLLEKKTKSFQDRLIKILDESLTDRQLKELSKHVEAGKLIHKMNLKEMAADTNLNRF